MAGMVAAGLAPRASWSDVGAPSFLSAGMKPNGTHVLCGLSADGVPTFEIPLPARGHAAAAHPQRPEAVAFARRPGRFAVILDCAQGKETARLHAPSGRHFYGHGAFSEDGEVLFTTENDYEAARGAIGVWDVAKDYARIGEFTSGGVGPHDIRLLPDGQTLVIANGGIETHPETGRTKLNLSTMRSNLTYMDLMGHVLDRVELPPEYRLNSIRHLSVSRDSAVALAMQWQGDVNDAVPLLGTHIRGHALSLTETSQDLFRDMMGYAGSIAVSNDLNQVAITFPRGGQVQIFCFEQLRLLQKMNFVDVCGVSAKGTSFLVTTGSGVVASIRTNDAFRLQRASMSWDNHLVAL